MYKRNPILLLLLAVFMAACEDLPTDPQFEDAPVGDQPTLSSAEVVDVELSIAADAGLAEETLGFAEIMLERSSSSRARPHMDNARRRFDDARREADRGDRERSRRAARDGRRAVADALVHGLGRSVVDELMFRTEALVIEVSASPNDYINQGELVSSVASVLAQSRTARDAGDDRTAAERALYARQRVDHDRTDRTDRGDGTDRDHDGTDRDRDHDGSDRDRQRDGTERDRQRDTTTDRARDRDTDRATDHLPSDRLKDKARLAVAAAGAAVSMADEILNSQGATEEQLRLFATAAELYEGAAAALAAGEFSRAIVLGHQSVTKAFVAVVSPDGVSQGEAEQLQGLAQGKFAQAVIYVEQNPTKENLWILTLADRFLEAGENKLSAGEYRAAGVLLWHSAVASAILVG